MQQEQVMSTGQAPNLENMFKFAETLNKALRESGKIKITFGRDSFDSIPYLLSMAGKEIISLSLQDYVILMTAGNSGVWDHDDDRTVVITLSEKFNEWCYQWNFLAMVGYALDDIEIVP